MTGSPAAPSFAPSFVFGIIIPLRGCDTQGQATQTETQPPQQPGQHDSENNGNNRQSSTEESGERGSDVHSPSHSSLNEGGERNSNVPSSRHSSTEEAKSKQRNERQMASNPSPSSTSSLRSVNSPVNPQHSPPPLGVLNNESSRNSPSRSDKENSTSQSSSEGGVKSLIQAKGSGGAASGTGVDRDEREDVLEPEPDALEKSLVEVSNLHGNENYNGRRMSPRGQKGGRQGFIRRRMEEFEKEARRNAARRPDVLQSDEEEDDNGQEDGKPRSKDRASSSSSYQRTPIPPGNHTRMLLRFMGGPTAVAGDGDGDDDDDFGGGGIHQGLLPGQDYDAVEDISGDDDDNDDNHNDDELNDDSQALGSTNDPISNRQSSTRFTRKSTDVNSEGKSGATADDDDSIPSEEEEELELDDEADDATDAIYEALPDNVKQVLNNFFKNSQAGEEAKADAMIVARAIYDLSAANGCPNLYRCFERDKNRSGWNNTVYYGGAVNDLKRVIVRRSKELSRTVKLKDSNRSRIWLKVVKCGKQVTAARDRASSSSSYQRTPIPPGNHTRIHNGESGKVWSETLASAIETKIVSRIDNRTFSKLPLSALREKRESKVVGLISQSFHVPRDDNDLFPGYISGNIVLPPRGIKDPEGVGLCSQVFNVGDCQPNSLEFALADPSGQYGKFDPKTAQRFLLSKGDMFQIRLAMCIGLRIAVQMSRRRCFGRL